MNTLPSRTSRGPAGKPGTTSPVFLLRAGAVLAALLLAACAEMPAPGSSRSASPAVVATEEASPATPTTDYPNPAALPANALDSPTLYLLVMAEIAAQRGMPESAYGAELNLARETRDPRIARRATEFALQAHQTGSALQATRLWLELDPSSAEARETLLTVLIVSGRLTEAEPMLHASLAATHEQGETFLLISNALARAPNHADALALCERLTADYLMLPEAHLAIAQCAQGANDGARVLAEARQAIALKPTAPNSILMAAQYLQSSAPDETEAALKDYLERLPKAHDVRLAYARFLVGQHRYGDARVQFQALLKAQPDDTETLYVLGLLAYQAEQPGDAETYLKRFIVLREHEAANADDDSDDAQDDSNRRSPGTAYLYLAQIAEDRKDYPAALNYLAQVEDGENVLNARLQRAVVLSRDGHLDQALLELKTLQVRNDRERVRALLTESQLLRDANRATEALSLIEDALKVHTDDPDLLYDVGMTAEKLDQLDLMESTFRRLIRLQPENAQAYNALGYTLADHNLRLDEARQLIEKAMTLSPEDASIVDSLGWVQYRLGEQAAALENLRHAYSLRNDAEIATHLGEVLWVSGKHAEAEKFWREAGHKEPDNEVLRATLARFNVRIGAL